MVWVGLAEDDEEKTVRPAAHAGYVEGYFDKVKISWGDNELGRGPVGTSIRIGKPCVTSDMHTEPRFQPWREEATRRGYECCISLPLFTNGKAIGAITLYRAETYCVDPAEENLLTQSKSFQRGIIY